MRHLKLYILSTVPKVFLTSINGSNLTKISKMEVCVNRLWTSRKLKCERTDVSSCGLLLFLQQDSEQNSAIGPLPEGDN